MLFRGHRYLAQTGATPRANPRQTAIGNRDRSRSASLRPGAYLLSFGEFVFGAGYHSKCAEAHGPLLACSPECRPHCCQAKRAEVCSAAVTFRPFEAALEGVARVRAHLRSPIYGVLGNHDTIQMVPAMEAMGIPMLLNECEVIARGDQRIYLAGIDDAHFFRVDNIEKAASQIPKDAFSILLSHTPEIYRQAAHANFNLMLSGHTHGGQLCLPGGIPIKLEAALPRRMGAGAWRYHNMSGYTSVGAGSSVVPVRLNCPPEITLHCLRRG